MKNILRPISLKYFAGIISLFTLVAFNIPMFQFAFTHADMSLPLKLFVIASLMVIMVALNFMLSYLLVFLTRYVGRVLIALTLIIDALAEYFVIVYKVMLDDTMISNIFNTRYSEASGYFSWTMLLCVIIFGVIPAVWVILQPVKYGKKKQMGIWCGGSIGLSLLLILANINQTLWISSYDTELGGLSMPWSYIANTFRYMQMHHVTEDPEIKLPDGEITDSTKTVVVLVIGESARKANFQLYGYKRQTNPLLSKQEGVVALTAQSCATYTTAGVRAILEPKDEGALYEILPNYAFRMGCDVSWRTANWGEPPVHIQEYMTAADLKKKYNEDDAVDGILFTHIKERILQSKKNKVLIILHTTTSHGPDYCLKVPKSFQKFTPMLNNVEQAEKNPQALINAYDNSILYTDYLLSNLIDSLRELTKMKTEGWRCAMIFVSDHGESLGENKVFMHGIPMNMAPREQYEIPFIVWTSPNYGSRLTLSSSSTFQVSGSKANTPVDQHWVFHSVLDLLSIKSPAYQPEYDIFQPLSPKK